MKRETVVDNERGILRELRNPMFSQVGNNNNNNDDDNDGNIDDKCKDDNR